MEFKDYYQIMGVSRDASQEEIKRAYRKLARKYHPDVSQEPDAEQRFKEVGEAYEVLKDPEKRAAYDHLGTQQQWQAGEDFRPPPDWHQDFEFSGGGFTGKADFDFSEFFETLFGKGANNTNRQRKTSGFDGFGGSGFQDFSSGEDQHAKISISLEEAYHGATRGLQLQTPEVNAQGQMVTKTRTLNVKIPPGVIEGQHIRLAGQGSKGLGNQSGDLYLEISFLPHQLFHAEGRDIYLTLPIAPWEAALGATIKIPTLGGTVDVKIPKGSQTGQKLRLKGRGFPGKPPGDQYVVLKILTPPATETKQETLYRQMADMFTEFNPRADMTTE